MDNKSSLEELANELSLAEFAGKFGYTIEKALFEIKEHGIRADNWLEQDGVGFNVGQAKYIPKAEVDRYALIKSEKPAEPLEHPCLNTACAFYPKRLALAVNAWEYAVSKSGTTKSNFMKRIDSFLDSKCIEGNERDRIREICNPWPRGPKSQKIL